MARTCARAVAVSCLTSPPTSRAWITALIGIVTTISRPLSEIAIGPRTTSPTSRQCSVGVLSLTNTTLTLRLGTQTWPGWSMVQSWRGISRSSAAESAARSAAIGTAMIELCGSLLTAS